MHTLHVLIISLWVWWVALTSGTVTFFFNDHVNHCPCEFSTHSRFTFTFVCRRDSFCCKFGDLLSIIFFQFNHHVSSNFNCRFKFSNVSIIKKETFYLMTLNFVLRLQILNWRFTLLINTTIKSKVPSYNFKRLKVGVVV